MDGSSPPAPYAAAATNGNGIDVDELAARVNGDYPASTLTPAALAAWLADSGLATRDERGRLHVTARARELAGAAFG